MLGGAWRGEAWSCGHGRGEAWWGVTMLDGAWMGMKHGGV